MADRQNDYNEDDLFLDDQEMDLVDVDEDEYYDDYDDYDDKYDDEDYYDDGDEYYDDYDDGYDDEDYYEDEAYYEDDVYDAPVAEEGEKKKKSSVGKKIGVGVGVLALVAALGAGGWFTYNQFSSEPAVPIEQQATVDSQQEETQDQQGEGTEEVAQEDGQETEEEVAFKYAISHAGKASDTLNKLNADFKTATSLYIQNNDIDAYKEALNAIESSRQMALAELAKYDANDLSVAVEGQYQQFFNALNTAFGAENTDQAVETFNTWNTMQTEFNQGYTQLLTNLLDEAGIEWSQTETEDGLTIVY